MKKPSSLNRKNVVALALTSTFVFAVTASVPATASTTAVSDSVITKQRAALEINTDGRGFGPQSPRDIDQAYGSNERHFSMGPNRSQKNL